jgi:hypothetical protein
MRNEFTAIIERDGGLVCRAMSRSAEANGQGSVKEAKSDLAAAIQLVLEDPREDA